MILNFFSSAILFTSIANATKLVEPVTLSVANTPSVATVYTTPALHHDDNQFLGQADTWSQAKCWRTRNMIKEQPYSDFSRYTDLTSSHNHVPAVSNNHVPAVSATHTFR